MQEFESIFDKYEMGLWVSWGMGIFEQRKEDNWTEKNS